MQVKDDKEYVECLKKDDFIAFDALFRKYFKNLYAFSLSINRYSFAAEEVTQLVSLNVWKKRTQMNEYLSFKSFLFSVACNEMISWFRKEKSQKRRINEFISITGFQLCYSISTIRKIMNGCAISQYNHLKMDEFLKSYEGNLEKFNLFFEQEWGWSIDYQKYTGFWWPMKIKAITFVL